MPLKSQFPDLDLPKVNLLTYIFPPGEPVSDTPIWHDSEDPSISMSKRQLLHKVKKLGVGLDKLGVKAGEVVLIFTSNHLLVPVVYLGVVGSKRVFSGVNPIYTIPEITHQIKNTEAKVVLVHPSLVDNALAAAQKAGFPANRLYQFSERPCQTQRGVQDWESMLGSDAEADAYRWPELRGEESAQTIATINYSSGTTGLPKGVCVSHRNLIANVAQTIFMRDNQMPYSPKSRPVERWNAFLPLYHAYGQLYTCIMAPKLGVKVYVMKKFEYAAFLRVIERYQITHLQVAPPILVMLGRRPETVKYNLSSVKHILCGAAPLSRELQNEIASRFNVQINQGWGMTEVTCGALHVPGGVNDDTGSVGLLHPNCEGKLLDDDGKEVKTGEPGELFVRGPNVCLGYWRNDQATADSLDKNGWLKTGDVAVVDERGMFYIVDRKKVRCQGNPSIKGDLLIVLQELIKVNGLQVAPAELEAALLEHPSIADAAVVGITLHNEEWPRAYVVLKEGLQGRATEQDIQSWIKPRVAKHKWLAGGVAFVDEVPKSASGKILRKVMREWAKKDVPHLEKRIKARL
jgi:4-coumarate--CoA ligase